MTTVRNEEPAFGTPADDAQPAVVLRGLSPTAASSLQAVGPGRALDEGVAASLEAAPAAPSPPPWVRRQRTPIIVRWANAITSGKVFTVILTILVGIALAAGAWALGVNANAPDEPAAVVVPVSSTSPSATPRPTPTITASPTPVEHRYVVRRGDTLTDIARLVYGDPNLWQVILDANRDVIDDADNLTVGVSLLIPELDAND